MWGYGATVARLTPDQKVGSSNLSALRACLCCRSLAAWPVICASSTYGAVQWPDILLRLNSSICLDTPSSLICHPESYGPEQQQVFGPNARNPHMAHPPVTTGV